MSERTTVAPTGERHEGGPTQFGDDWPGVFLRGDYAGPMGFVLSQVIEKAKKGEAISPFDLLQLEGLASSLAASEVHPGQKVTKLRPFKECAL